MTRQASVYLGSVLRSNMQSSYFSTQATRMLDFFVWRDIQPLEGIRRLSRAIFPVLLRNSHDEYKEMHPDGPFTKRDY